MHYYLVDSDFAQRNSYKPYKHKHNGKTPLDLLLTKIKFTLKKESTGVLMYFTNFSTYLAYL